MQHKYQQYHLDKSATSMRQDSTPTEQKNAQMTVRTVVWVSICPLQVPCHHDCHKLPPSTTTRASRLCMYFLFYLFFIYTNMNFYYTDCNITSTCQDGDSLKPLGNHNACCLNVSRDSRPPKKATLTC